MSTSIWWRLFFAIMILLPSSFALAKEVKGFVNIYEGRDLYVEYKEAESGHPTLILLHGMTYSTQQWQKFIDKFKSENPSAGILNYDMYGMGQTLLRYRDKFLPWNFQDPAGRVHYVEQTEDLRHLIDKLEVKGDIHLAGLSYGGGIAQYFMKTYGRLPKIKSAILMAPFMTPLKGQVEIIEAQIKATRIFFPFNQFSDEQLYDYFLRQLVYTTYPSAEPVILENPYKLEATYRLAQGMKDFDGFKFQKAFPQKSIHMMIPMLDEYLSEAEFGEYWESLPPSRRASRLLIEGARHKLPEEVPTLTSNWISRLIYDESGEYKQGKTYNSEDFGLTSDCESVLE